jgi:N-acetylmuramoyl-L-alanine amidase
MGTLANYPLVLAAIDLWREAQNQSYAAQAGVTWVIKNRVNAGHDLVHVITQKFQFSSMTAPGDVNLTKWAETLPPDPAFPQCCSIIDGVFTFGTIADPTGGATFYFSLPVTEPPHEWGAVVITKVIDGITFCKPA